MRWDDLFADLEGQLEQGLDAEDLDVAAEEERLRLGRLGLRDRIASLAGGTTGVELTDGTRVELRVETVGRDWVSGRGCVDRAGPGRSCVVPFAGVAALIPDPACVAASLAVPAERPDALSRRLGLAFVLRDLCRRRSPVELVTPARILHGTIDRVGRDHLDLAEHEPGEPRRADVVRGMRLVPFERVLLVRL